MDGDMRLKGSRARFLGAAGLTGAAIATGAWKTGTVGAASAPADPHDFNTGRFGIDLGSGWEALVKSVEGGNIVGNVVREQNSAAFYQKKHIGNVKYEEVSFKIGLPSKGVYDWIATTLAGQFTRKTFWLSTLDANFVEVARRQFNNALISEIGFPALDGSSKDAAYLTIKIAPESIEDRPASGKTVTLDASKQKTWLQSNFRLELKPVATSRVSKIDAFTIKQTLVTDPFDEVKEPGKLEFPNVAAFVSSIDLRRGIVAQGLRDQRKQRRGRRADGRDRLSRPAAQGDRTARARPRRHLQGGAGAVRSGPGGGGQPVQRRAVRGDDEIRDACLTPD